MILKLRVYIESPFASIESDLFELYKNYVHLAIRDCIERGEAPFASHAFYTNYLDDSQREQRVQGMEMGQSWAEVSGLIAVYEDYGISKGMHWGMSLARQRGQKIEHRSIREML